MLPQIVIIEKGWFILQRIPYINMISCIGLFSYLAVSFTWHRDLYLLSLICYLTIGNTNWPWEIGLVDEWTKIHVLTSQCTQSLWFLNGFQFKFHVEQEVFLAFLPCTGKTSTFSFCIIFFISYNASTLESMVKCWNIQNSWH